MPIPHCNGDSDRDETRAGSIQSRRRELRGWDEARLVDPTRPFGELDGLLDSTCPFGKLDGVFGPTRRFGELDNGCLRTLIGIKPNVVLSWEARREVFCSNRRLRLYYSLAAKREIVRPLGLQVGKAGRRCDKYAAWLLSDLAARHYAIWPLGGLTAWHLGDLAARRLDSLASSKKFGTKELGVKELNDNK
ncbi:hypothetical protein F2Q70_00003639 [Brassica cretica]|uniref:Uncharacterized protein n=1 Tax=Brassica cretica TaxID=69181 RepID=A0A8S9IZ11_BRACR|nr:hypothetical protein F2Q70_00003639 [Brassica cretica]